MITCVSRDDLPDGGAEQFVRTIAEIRRAAVGCVKRTVEEAERTADDGGAPRAAVPICPTIEVLPSDFAGNTAAVDRLIDAAPEVYNHNTETVPRLFHAVRDQRTDYRWTLDMFRRIRRANPRIALKTGLMLGLGETTDELLDALAELFGAGCQILGDHAGDQFLC